MYCRKCGNKIRTEASFCSKCGMVIDNVSVSRKTKKETETKSKKIAIAIVCLFLVIVVISSMCFFYFTQKCNVLRNELNEAMKTEFMTIVGYSENKNNPLLVTLAEGFEIDIKKISKNKNEEYEVFCIFSNYDILKALEKINEKENENELSLKKFYKLLATELKNTEKLSYKTTISVFKDNSYIVKFTQEQFYHASGRLFDLYDKLLTEEGMLNEFKN